MTIALLQIGPMFQAWLQDRMCPVRAAIVGKWQFPKMALVLIVNGNLCPRAATLTSESAALISAAQPDIIMDIVQKAVRSLPSKHLQLSGDCPETAFHVGT